MPLLFTKPATCHWNFEKLVSMPLGHNFRQRPSTAVRRRHAHRVFVYAHGLEMGAAGIMHFCQPPSAGVGRRRAPRRHANSRWERPEREGETHGGSGQKERGEVEGGLGHRLGLLPRCNRYPLLHRPYPSSFSEPGLQLPEISRTCLSTSTLTSQSCAACGVPARLSPSAPTWHGTLQHGRVEQSPD